MAKKQVSDTFIKIISLSEKRNLIETDREILSILKTLFSKKENNSESLNALILERNTYHLGILSYIVLAEAINSFRFIMENVPNDILHIDDRYELKETVVFMATRYKKYNILETILKFNPSLNLKNINGYTLLHIAINESVDPKIIKLLLDSGANPKIKNSQGQTPEDWAKAKVIGSYPPNVNDPINRDLLINYQDLPSF